ncbi:MAG: glucose-6-phosphate dehydrogenase [Gemmatimonadaceae bacterium]
MTSEVQEAEASVFVIFGGTGDLARRKILPALFQLHAQGATRRGCVIIGVTRDTDMDDVRFRSIAVEAAVAAGNARGEATAWAASSVFFQSVPDASRASYVTLKTRIESLETGTGNRAFYVALPPQAFEPTIRGLGESGLNRSSGWTRLVIEKPFGRDLASARALNDLLHQYFDESQIFRIDHYLGKETVQNLLVFRFANAMFETLWNRNHIECVKITVAEEVGVEQRAGYYDGAGALRDMVQSHLTQLLALVAMEVPSAITADAIRMEKIKALRAIVPLEASNVVLAQYDRGRTADGRELAAYREEPGVAADSRTETFAAVRLDIDNWRWQGVPFFLRTGKRLGRRLTEIEVTFRRAPVWMFRTVKADGLSSNTLLLTLQPDEGFSLFVDVKVPGEPFRLHRLPLHFNYSEAFKTLPEAYQTLLLDLLLGDSTLFVHADEVEVAWALYQPLLGGAVPVHSYPAGGSGPPEAERLAGMPTPT